MESKYREVGGKENGQRAAPCEAAPNGAQQSRSSGFVGRGGWIRFSAEKPRAGERATGTSAGTALSNPPSNQK